MNDFDKGNHNSHQKPPQSPTKANRNYHQKPPQSPTKGANFSINNSGKSIKSNYSIEKIPDIQIKQIPLLKNQDTIIENPKGIYDSDKIHNRKISSQHVIKKKQQTRYFLKELNDTGSDARNKDLPSLSVNKKNLLILKKKDLCESSRSKYTQYLSKMGGYNNYRATTLSPKKSPRKHHKQNEN